MSKLHKIIIATICVFVAYLLPANLARTTETGIQIKPIKQIQAVQAVSHPQKEQVAPIVPEPVKTAPSGSNVFNGSGDYYLDWIISHESGGNPYAVNSIGACGLGQSLPCSKVLSVCGSLDNVSCQIDWVRNYCISRYGSTLAAYNFWVANRWY